MEMFVKSSCVIAGAAGKDGMIAGQVIDMESEGRQIPEETLKTMHRKRQGHLLWQVLLPRRFLPECPMMK